MHKITLRFLEDEKLEELYQKSHFENSRSFVHVGFFTGLFIMSFFYIVDWIMFNKIYKELFFLRSLNVGIPILLGLYTFVLNKKSNYLFWISFICSVLSGVFQTHTLAIAQENVHLLYFPGIILIMMYNFCFLKQRFVHASISAGVIAVYFNAILLNSPIGSTKDIILMNTFMAASIFIGLWVSYILEFSWRRQFLLTQRLKQANDDRKEIYKVVVHDLKNPVSIIKSQINLMKAANKIEEKFSKRILNSTDRMLYLLDHLLKFCEIEEAQTKVDYKEYNIQEIMDICIENNLFAAENKRIIINHIKPKSPFITKIDAFKTQEAIDNIISNAIKYSPTDRDIDISYAENTDNYLVKIKDYGQGIKEEEISKVFDKFTKLSSIPTAGENSNGLGLSLSKNLMDLQGGNITCESKFGEWTLFTVYIPKRDTEEKAA